MGINGILNVNKPPGCTSFSIVAMIRRLTGEKRVGHAGTLDPAATGVLPVCLGQATRIVEYLHDCPKEYIAGIELGTSTDTLDGDGNIICRRDPGHVTFSSIQSALASFSGTISQIPPSYSAIKIKGRQSYEFARAGINIPLQPRKVRIDCIDILAFELPYLKIKILCSKGTYIRSIANDLGNMLECGAYLKDLVRTAYGPYRISDSISPDEIQTAIEGGSLSTLLYPPDHPLMNWEKQQIDEERSIAVVQGHDIVLDTASFENHYCRLYDSTGKFLSIMKFIPETGLWHPEKVFNL